MFMNNVSIAGYVATDPIFRGNENANRNVLTFNLRVKRQGRGTDSDFFSVVVFGAYAKTMAELVAKGRSLGVVGTLRQNRYEQEGSKRDRVEVVADHIALGSEPTKPANPLAGLDTAAIVTLLQQALGTAGTGPTVAAATTEDSAFDGQPDGRMEMDFDDTF